MAPPAGCRPPRAGLGGRGGGWAVGRLLYAQEGCGLFSSGNRANVLNVVTLGSELNLPLHCEVSIDCSRVMMRPARSVPGRRVGADVGATRSLGWTRARGRIAWRMRVHTSRVEPLGRLVKLGPHIFLGDKGDGAQPCRDRNAEGKENQRPLDGKLRVRVDEAHGERPPLVHKRSACAAAFDLRHRRAREVSETDV